MQAATFRTAPSLRSRPCASAILSISTDECLHQEIGDLVGDHPFCGNHVKLYDCGSTHTLLRSLSDVTVILDENISRTDKSFESLTLLLKVRPPALTIWLPCPGSGCTEFSGDAPPGHHIVARDALTLETLTGIVARSATLPRTSRQRAKGGNNKEDAVRTDLLRNSLDAIFAIDENGVVLYANRAAELLTGECLYGRVLGVPIEGVDGTHVNILDDRDLWADAKLLVSRSSWKGRPVYLVVLKRAASPCDPTARQARPTGHQEEAVAALLAQLREDLQSVLTLTRRSADQIAAADTFGEHGAFGDFVNDIRKDCRRVWGNINDLVDFSIIENRLLRSGKQKIQLNRLLRSSLNEIGALGIRLESQLDADDIQIEGDHYLLSRAIINMAQDFSGKAAKETNVLFASSIRGANHVEIYFEESSQAEPENHPPDSRPETMAWNDWLENSLELETFRLSFARAIAELHGGNLRIVSSPFRRLTMVLPCLNVGKSEPAPGDARELLE